jgi:uncharacterized membrane protein
MNKWWKRLLISIVIAALLAESISVATNEKIQINAFIFAILLYLVLSIVQGFRERKKNK